MVDLAQWLQEHLGTLTEAATTELSSNHQLRSSVEDSISAFYEALVHAVAVNNMVPLHAILIDWVEARSAPTEEEPAGLMPVLATLKRVTFQHICDKAKSKDAVDLLMTSEGFFSDASSYLASLEAEALLNDVRREL